MPFPTALSAGEITQVRQPEQAFEHYLLVNPNDIVWQAEVNDTKSAVNYAQFDWTNTTSGNRANVMVGMVMMITAASDDFSDPVRRGRIRETPDATTVYCNEDGTDIDATMYVTVFDDFDIMERLQRVGPDGTKYKDWDDTWSDLPPIIYDLQSVYADFSEAATVDIAFAPSATAVADGRAISTWSWDIGDGSFQAGNANTQNITARFPGYETNEHRWVHLTVTDDNGNSITFHFEVYTVAKHSSTAVKLDSGSLQINGTIEDGWNGVITARNGLAESEVYDQTRVAIAGIDSYDGTSTPIVSNILFVGRLRQESDLATADETSASYSETTFTLEGFATQLAGLPAPALSIQDEASPDAWGEMTDPNPLRSIVYFLAFHTTFCTLSSISHDDLSGYVLGDFSLGETSALDNVNRQMDSCNGIAAFAPSGETTLRRKASYQADADRAGLTTVFDFTTADITPTLAMDYEYGEQVGEIEAGAVVYNTTIDDIQYRYIGRAPASTLGSGHERAQLNGQVLIADSSDGEARGELVQRTADHLAYINNKVRMDVGLMDGFWWLIPTLHQRYTFTLAATDTARGRVYSSSQYWQLLSVSYTADNETNERLLTATFEAETQGENAGVAVTLVPDVNGLDYSLPPLSAYDSFPDDPLTNFPVDDPETDPYMSGTSQANQADGNNSDSPLGCEALNIPFFSDLSRATTRSTENAETYVITVEGEAVIGITSGLNIDFSDATKYSFVDTTGSAPPYLCCNPSILEGSPPAGSSSGGNAAEDGGIYDSTIVGANRYRNGAYCKSSPFSAVKTIESVSMNIYRTDGTIGDGEDIAIYCELYDDGDVRIGLMKKSFALTNDAWTACSLSSTDDLIEGTNEGVSYCYIGSQNTSGSTFNNDYYTDDIVLATSSVTAHGDAFYYDYDNEEAQLYPGAQGFQLDGDRPTGIPAYNPAHYYQFTATGDGSTFSFHFELADYSEVNHNQLLVTICGPNMGTTT